MMLQITNLQAGYGNMPILNNCALALPAGTTMAIMGRNGAGKSTLLKTIMGATNIMGGDILLNDVPITTLPAHNIPKLGVALVPQGRRLFSELSVLENLQVGLLVKNNSSAIFDQIFTMFPRLKERLHQTAGTLSGGEQQMLAIGRALASEPKLLLLDEPTEGLQPSMISLIRNVVAGLKDMGLTTIIVEHRIDIALKIADTIVFMENGETRECCNVADLTPESPVFHHYIGV